jgi:two-component system cell cycle sensor histidine kinase/response regulator CckA
VILSAILVHVNFIDWWYAVTREHEDWQLDELLSIAIGVLIVGTVFALRYISMINRALSALDQANKAIASQTQERIQQAKLSALGALSSGMAHEINNALQPAIGLGQFILKDLQKNDNTKHSQYMQTILDSSKHAQEIIENVLEYSREKSIELTPYLASDVIAQTIHFCTNLLPSSLIFKTLQLPHDKPDIWDICYISCDKTSLTQIMMNLLKNASRAMNDKGTITIISEYGPMPCTGEHAVILSVSDHGTGMDEDTQTKIFDPFFTTGDVSEGTGLGLAAVYGLMQLHHGAIDVASTPGKGTTFRLYFPVHSTHAPLGEPVNAYKNG